MIMSKFIRDYRDYRTFFFSRINESNYLNSRCILVGDRTGTLLYVLKLLFSPTLFLYPVYRCLIYCIDSGVAFFLESFSYLINDVLNIYKELSLSYSLNMVD